MHQTSLFDPPRTAAAKAIRPAAGRLCKIVLHFFASRGSYGATDEELSEGVNLKESTARARRCELRDIELIRDSGLRRQTSSGHKATVWIITTPVTSAAEDPGPAGDRRAGGSA